MGRRAAALGVLLSVSGAFAAPGKEAEELKSGVFEPPREAPGFTLRGSDGQPLTLGSYRGKVVILEFGFSSCPKICPFTLATLRTVFQQLGPAAKDVQLVFVTVDPERDTPELLGEFLHSFNPTFLGATGTPDELDAVRKTYGVLATKERSEEPDVGYLVHHSSSLFLIDREGLLRALVPFGKPAEDIVHDLRLLLKK